MSTMTASQRRPIALIIDVLQHTVSSFHCPRLSYIEEQEHDAVRIMQHLFSIRTTLIHGLYVITGLTAKFMRPATYC